MKIIDVDIHIPGRAIWSEGAVHGLKFYAVDQVMVNEYGVVMCARLTPEHGGETVHIRPGADGGCNFDVAGLQLYYKVCTKS